MEYSEKVLDHFTHPRNVGKIDDADGVGEVGNAKCGDIMKMYIKVKDGIITDVKFNTFGCASAIAASSLATELIKGKPLDYAMGVTNKQVVDELGGLRSTRSTAPCSPKRRYARRSRITAASTRHKVG